MEMTDILHIKQVTVGGDNYELLSKYIQDVDGGGHTWEEITALVGAGIQLVTDTAGEDGAPATAASKDTMGKIYLVATGALSGTHVEYITVHQNGAYKWEKIGTTAADLTAYAKKDTYASSSAGAHTHTVTGNVNIPTVAKTSKKLGIKHKTDVTIGVATSGTAVTNVTTATDEVLGSATTFDVTGGDVTVSHIKATASGTTVGVNGTANAITALGTPTTTAAITGFGAHDTDTFIKNYATPTTDMVLGADTTITATGGAATSKNIKATASGAAISTDTDTFVKSYPGVTSKLQTTTLKGVNGTTSVPSSVSVGIGAKAATFTPSVSGGVLSFAFSAENLPSVSVGNKITVATAAGSSTTVVTGIGADGNGATIMTGLGQAVTGTAVNSASISTQPTIKLDYTEKANSNTVKVVTGVSAVGVSVGNNDRVNAMTGLGDPTTATAITNLGTPTTAAAITGFGTHTTATVAKGVKVTSQPTITLATDTTGGVGKVDVVTGVSEIGISVGTNDKVTTITGINKTTDTFAKTVKVTQQPAAELVANANTGVDYVDTVTIGSTTTALKNGSTSNNGAHTHNTTI